MEKNYSFQAPADQPPSLPTFEVNPNAEKTSLLKNPDHNFTTNSSVNVTIVGEDDRVPVHVNEGYDSVVRLKITDADGRTGLCTGTIQNIEGYTHEGTIVTTAAHCIPENVAHITAYGDYETSEGGYRQFQLYKGEAYVHSDFATNNSNPTIINDPTTDAAVIHFDETPPDGVEPSTFVPLEISEVNGAMVDLGNYDGVRGITVNSTGFSGDQIGLSVDEACSIYSGNDQSLLTTCDGAQGSSGGPNFIASQDGDLVLGANDQPISIAVNSNSGFGLGGGKTAISSDFFDAVEVLEKEEICVPEGRVTAERGLNRREGAGVDYYKVQPDVDGTPSALPYGDKVGLLEEGDGWSMVIGEDGRFGYSSNEYIAPTGDCFEIEEGATDPELEREEGAETDAHAVEGRFDGPDADIDGDQALLRDAKDAGLPNPVTDVGAAVATPQHTQDFVIA